MENLRNFGYGSQGAGNDAAGLREHTDEGLRAMRPKFFEKSDFFFRARSSFFWKYWWAVSSAPAMA
jgi:hypothetical protein